MMAAGEMAAGEMAAGEMAAATMAAALECRGLTKVFRDFWLRPRVRAVDDLTFDVRPGEVFGLLGPNGSGKTTTIKMALGLLRPTSGSLRILGQLPDHVGTKSRIGFLPEESTLYPFLDGRETLEFFGRLLGLGRSARRERAERLLDLVGLTEAASRRVGEYSKGMQRRLGLAQALIGEPDLVILDEPTSGLDPMGSRLVKDLILDLRSRGATVLLSSHLLGDVEDVCDRIMILYSGRLQALGTTDELLSEDDRRLIEIDRLSEERQQRVESAIEAEGATVHSVRPPRQKLEAYFVRTIEEARGEGQNDPSPSSDDASA